MWRWVGKLQHHFQYDSRTPGHTKNRLFPWSQNDQSTYVWIYDRATILMNLRQKRWGKDVWASCKLKQEDSKWQSRRVSVITLNTLDRGRINMDFKKSINGAKKKKKLKQNSIVELLGTSINWFLATSSQPYQGFWYWWLELTVLRVGCCFWITVEFWLCRRRVILSLGKVWNCL